MKKYLAELVGTFALVFSGTGAIVVNELYGGKITHVGIAITFGLVVTAMIYTFGEISGAHINPAVTIAFGINGEIKKKEIPPYIISQLIGAIFASALIKFLFPRSVNLGSTIPVGSVWQSFVLEFVLTYILMLVIFRVPKNEKTHKVAGIVIGGTVLLEAMLAGPVCGASMNPARSFAPAIFSGNLSTVWLYITAPITGAIVASFTQFIFGEK